MSLMQVYEKYFGEKTASAEKKVEKKADEAAAVQAEAQAGTAGTQAEAPAQVELSDAEIDKALEGMSDDELAALAKEVAADVKESQAAEAAEEEKLAAEYYAAGRIFAQGFLAEANGSAASKEAAAAPAAEEKKASAIDKFAALLSKEIGG